MNLLVLVALSCIALTSGDKPYHFKCQPREGCDFSGCGTSYLIGGIGFDLFGNDDDDDHHLECEPKFDMHDDHVTKDELNKAIADIRADLKKSDDERKKDKEHCNSQIHNINERLKKMQDHIAKMSHVDCSMYPNAFQYHGKCFWLRINYAYTSTRTYDLTKSWCEADGGDLANVYSSDHYKLIETAARKKLEGANIFFWTKMMYDMTDKKVYLGNKQPAPYTRWYSSAYPTTYSGHDGIKIQFNKDINSKDHGYYNRPHSEDSKGGLCEAHGKTGGIEKKIAELAAQLKKILDMMALDCSKYPDAFEYKGKCYFLIIKYDGSESKSYDVTRKWCQAKGGDTASVYSSEHYKKLETAARAKLEGANIYFWTAMTYQLEGDKVFLGDMTPAPFVRWYSSSYPTKSSNNNGIKIQFNKDVNSKDHGYYNRPRSETSRGVFCEAKKY